MSQKWHLNSTEIKAIIKNALIFSAPALIVFVTQIQAGVNIMVAINALYVWVLGVILDGLRKLSAGK